MASNYIVNSYNLDIEALEDDLREIIKSTLRNQNIIDEFDSEVYVLPMNVDFTPKTKLPAVWLAVERNGTYERTQEDIQVEKDSRFNVLVETYTTGDESRRQNIHLAQYVINILQTNQKLTHFYNRGLRLETERELSSVVSGVNRRQIRFTGLMDNENKLILNKF